MTILDIVIIVMILIFILIGIWRGLVLQLFNLGGLIFAYLLARPFGGLMEGFFARFASSPTTAHLISLVVAGALVYVVVAIIGRFINRQVKEGGDGLNWRNRMWGGVIGLIKGLLMGLALLFIIDAFPRPLPAEGAEEPAPLSPSALLKAAHYINPLPNTQYIQQLTQILQSKEAGEKLKDDPDLKKLLEYKKIQKVLDDHELMDAIERRDFKYLFHDEKLRELLKDREIRVLIWKVFKKLVTAQEEEAPEEEAPANDNPENEQPEG